MNGFYNFFLYITNLFQRTNKLGIKTYSKYDALKSTIPFQFIGLVPSRNLSAVRYDPHIQPAVR